MDKSLDQQAPELGASTSGAVAPVGSTISAWLARCAGDLRRWLGLGRVAVIHLAAPPHTPGDPEAVADALAAYRMQIVALGMPPGAELIVTLSSRWGMAMALPDATTPAAAREQALRRWTSYFDMGEEEPAGRWAVSCAWHPRAKVVHAVPVQLRDGLRQIAQTHSLRLSAVLPWWAPGLVQRLDGQGEAGARATWTWQESSWALRASARCPDEGGAWVLDGLAMDANCDGAVGEELVARMGDDGDIDPLPVLPQGYGLSRQAMGWGEALNAVGPRIKVGFWGWAVLVMGGAVLLHAHGEVRDVEARLDAAQEVSTRLEASAMRVRPPTGSNAGGPAQADVAPALADASLQRAVQLAVWLGFPWRATLDGIDRQARESGVMLSDLAIDIAPLGQSPEQGADILAQGYAADEAAALRWAAAPGARSVLRKMERLQQPVSTSAGSMGVRAQLVRPVGEP